MNVFGTVKTSINTREAAARYGVEVNRHGKALCPFHNDRNPSLFVDDDHYYCYACGEHGDVIDFTAKLFGLKMYEAAHKTAQVVAFLEKYIPDVAAMEMQMKKYEKFFKTADGKQKELEKKNDELSAALEESEKESTVKKLQELRLQSDYERVKGILDRIPPEIIKAYTHRSTQKHDINR